MAARKKTKNKAKPHYVRAKKRKGAESAVIARRVATIALLLLVVVGVFYAVYRGYEWIKGELFSNNPRFEIQHLEISSDGKLGEDYIREISGLREGMNLFELSFGQIFGTCFWLGFGGNLLIAEIWINQTREKSLRA